MLYESLLQADAHFLHKLYMVNSCMPCIEWITWPVNAEPLTNLLHVLLLSFKAANYPLGSSILMLLLSALWTLDVGKHVITQNWVYDLYRVKEQLTAAAAFEFLGFKNLIAYTLQVFVNIWYGILHLQLKELPTLPRLIKRAPPKSAVLWCSVNWLVFCIP